MKWNTALIGFTVFLMTAGWGFAEDQRSDVPAQISEETFTQQREAMVDKQMRDRGIRDPQVLKAMKTVPRHKFVHPLLKPLAYQDSPLPIGHKQTISQPYIVAYMTEVLELDSEDRVLEIGTGSGYQAAVLSEIVKEVYSIEIISALAQEAKKRLDMLGYRNVIVKDGDGYQGWQAHAPFDAIIVTAAPPSIPPKLLEQLAVGGRMIVPVGSVSQELVLITKTEEGTQQETLLPVRFVPMVPASEKK